jgi:hypothetical protein
VNIISARASSTKKKGNGGKSNGVNRTMALSNTPMRAISFFIRK